MRMLKQAISSALLCTSLALGSGAPVALAQDVSELVGRTPQTMQTTTQQVDVQVGQFWGPGHHFFHHHAFWPRFSGFGPGFGGPWWSPFDGGYGCGDCGGC